jgi:hypothetical protein
MEINNKLIKEYSGIVGKVILKTIDIKRFPGDYDYFQDLRIFGMIEMFKMYQVWSKKEQDKRAKFSTYLYTYLGFRIKNKLVEYKTGVKYSTYSSKKVSDKIKTDPEYREKLNAYRREYNKKRRDSDPQWVIKIKLQKQEAERRRKSRRKELILSRDKLSEKIQYECQMCGNIQYENNVGCDNCSSELLEPL